MGLARSCEDRPPAAPSQPGRQHRRSSSCSRASVASGACLEAWASHHLATRTAAWGGSVRKAQQRQHMGYQVNC
eukprot:scaffold49736_cov56-Prasinocladus_malaysianus.AAC.1